MSDGPDSSAVPLAVYLHFPWCVAKCPYCDFNSHALRDGLPEQAYVDALLADLDWELSRRPEHREIVSVFLGGGTPSLFPPAAIGRALDGLAQRLTLRADAEITLEANPGTVDAAHFAGYRAAGVNRLSIGVQSFDDAQLRRLGRIHDAEAAREAVRIARGSGFDNLNLDLMFALPEQGLAAAARDLDHALALEPEHLSYYHLTIEPNTAFARTPPPLPDADLAADMLDQAAERFGARGFERYEVSAWAREARRCAHNLNYWQFGDYLGLGAGAHGKRSSGGTIERRARQRHPARYQETAGGERAVQDTQPVDESARVFEYLMNRLRLTGPAPLAEFEQRTGLPRAALQQATRALVRDGLLSLDDDQLQTTPTGFAHLNTGMERLL